MEFLIKRTDGEWFDLHKNQLADTLRPASGQTKITAGQGDHCVEIDGVTIHFSIEDVGIQVRFENTNIKLENAEQIVQDILQNIEDKTHQKGEIVFLG